METDAGKEQDEEVLKRTVTKEWNGLDAFKKKQFNIPASVQHEMINKNQINDINVLRNAVL